MPKSGKTKPANCPNWFADRAQMTELMTASVTQTDAVIIGAGPVGLFQVFQLGLLGLHAHVIDSLPHPGGQPAELYADKPIFDIPGIPVCTGQQLTHNLLAQIAPFRATFHWEQVVTELQPQPDGRFLVSTSQGTRLLAKTVFIAAGVGAFQPRSIKLDGMEPFLNRQVFHRIHDAADLAGQQVLIVGDGEDAIDWALRLSDAGPGAAASVVLIHRRDAFKAPPDKVAAMRERCAQNRMQFLAGQPVGAVTDAHQLTHLKVLGSDGITRQVAVDRLLILLGLSPKLGPVTEWGLDIERKQLVVDTEKFSTSVPGIFAVGDINTYPGKKKLILCGFHEATLAAYAAAHIIHPDQPVLLQYTTTSPQLHKRLGVNLHLQSD